MSGTISFNPFLTSQPQNSFLSPTQGYMQGLVYDDPTARMELAGGILASTETIVMWGGRPITEQIDVNAAGNADSLGGAVASATGTSNITGWSVFAASYVMPPGGAYPPVAGVSNAVNFYRYGSNARLAVAADPALITSITGGTNAINALALYWDVTNYRITLTTSGGNWALPTTTKLLNTNASNSKIITYSAGQASWVQGSAAIIQF